MTTEQRKEEEIWKDVVGYEGLYQVSSMGRMKSFQRNPKGRLLKIFLRSSGNNDRLYYATVISKNGKSKTVSVHILMGDAFFGVCKDGKIVDHKNNISTDNNLSNLQRITQRFNLSKDKGGSSRFTGVYWNKAIKKWRAQIHYDGRKITLGTFHDEIEASKAYQQALEYYNKLKSKLPSGI